MANSEIMFAEIQLSLSQEDLEARWPALQKMLSRHVMSKVHDAVLAQDLVQDTLLQAFKKIEDLRDENKLLPWLKTIADRLIYKQGLQSSELFFFPAVEAVAEKENTATEFLDDFDRVVRVLASVENNQRDLLIVGMHFCAGWSAQEIASYNYMKTSTVSRRIRAVKRKLKDKGRLLEGIPTREAEIKFDMVSLLANAAFLPCSGADPVSPPLMQEAYRLMKRTVENFSRHPRAISLMMVICFFQARMSEYRKDMRAHTSPESWRREFWDEKYLNEAEDYYRQFTTLDAEGLYRHECEYYYHLYSPRCHEDVDWNLLLEHCNQLCKLVPKHMWSMTAASCIRQIDGPGAAIKQLLKWKNNQSLANNRGYHRRLALYYYDEGNWSKAKTALRALLQAAPMNDASRLLFQEMLDDCVKRLKS